MNELQHFYNRIKDMYIIMLSNYATQTYEGKEYYMYNF